MIAIQTHKTGRNNQIKKIFYKKTVVNVVDKQQKICHEFLFI